MTYRSLESFSLHCSSQVSFTQSFSLFSFLRLPPSIAVAMSGTDLGQVTEKDLKRVRAGHLSYLKRKIDSFNESVSTMDKRAPD